MTNLSNSNCSIVNKRPFFYNLKKLFIKERLDGLRGRFYLYIATWILNNVYKMIIKEVGQRTINMLDIGCGPGILTHDMAKLNPNLYITGIDISPLMNKYAVKSQKLDNISYHLMDATQMSFANNNFHFLLSTFSFHHFKDSSDKLSFLNEAYRVLKKGEELWIYECLSDFSNHEAKRGFRRFFGLPPIWYLKLVFYSQGFSEQEYRTEITEIINNSNFSNFRFERKDVVMKIVLRK